LYFPANLSWLATLSRLMPITSAFALPKSGSASLKPQASFVQPGVSSFG
jgi:hypothetical protein